MRIATWNLDHRAGKRRLTPARLLTQALREMAVDVVVLTEFVPRRSPGFETAIQDAGLAYLKHSELKGSGNNVLIAMWEWIEGSANNLKDVPAVILGDFNVDPNPDRMSKKWQCPDRMRAMENEWQRVPTTGASYWSVGRSPAGQSLSRPRQLDHAFVSRHLHVRKAFYQTTTVSCVLVDPEKPRSRETALSDHAALIIEVELAP